MDRRRRALIAVALVIGVSITIGALLFLPEVPPDDDNNTVQIEPHPFNDLDWWDIAWELGESKDFLTPFSALAGMGSRWDGTAGYYSAADYMIERLQSMGLEASYWGLHDSVVGYQQGYGNDSRAVVFGAHLDSDEGATGVNQNIGGCSVVHMIASTLSKFRLPIDIYYCFFSYNMVYSDGLKIKRALYGSFEVAQALYEQGVDVIAFFNIDEVLYQDPDQDDSSRIVIEHRQTAAYGYHETKYFSDLMVSYIQASGGDIAQAVERSNTDADHLSFWSRGFPAVNVKSGHTFSPYSPPADTSTNPRFNKTQAMIIGRAASAATLFLALRGNNESTTMKIASSLSPGESRRIVAVSTTRYTPKITGAACATKLLVHVYNDTHTLLSREAVNGTDFSFAADSATTLGPLSVIVTNVGNVSAKTNVTFHYESDIDGNGVLDPVQYSWPAPDPPLDWDEDGLSDIDEHSVGTDMFVPDTDSDSVKDGVEYLNGLDPFRDDTLEDLDGDGLTNIRELALGTMPNSNDTDSDLLPDLWEVQYQTDPLVNDSMADSDGDGLTNLEEYRHGADPRSSDGDRDGVADSEEVARGMNPMSEDTDGDGLRDFLELSEGLNPLLPDYDMDLQSDGYDANPRVNEAVVILLMVVGPVTAGSFVFWKRIR